MVRGTDTPENGSGEGAGILQAEASGPDIHVSPTTSPSLLSATKGPPKRLPGRQRASGGAASPLEASSSELLQGLRAHPLPTSTSPPSPPCLSALAPGSNCSLPVHPIPWNQQTKPLPGWLSPQVPPARPLAPTVLHTSADPPQDILLPALALPHICLTPALSKGS